MAGTSCGGASREKIAVALRYRGAPDIPTRFAGKWLTNRVVRITMITPEGNVRSRHHSPTIGSPPGGALSPVMWEWRVKRGAERLKTTTGFDHPDVRGGCTRGCKK